MLGLDGDLLIDSALRMAKSLRRGEYTSTAEMELREAGVRNIDKMSDHVAIEIWDGATFSEAIAYCDDMNISYHASVGEDFAKLFVDGMVVLNLPRTAGAWYDWSWEDFLEKHAADFGRSIF